MVLFAKVERGQSGCETCDAHGNQDQFEGVKRTGV